MATSRNSMLEKILEDCPNSNNQTLNQVKNESMNRDLNDFLTCPSFLSSFNHSKPYNSSQPASSQLNFITDSSTSSLNNRMNSHINLPNTTSFFNNDHQPSYCTNTFSNHSSSSSTSSADRNKMNNLNLQLNKSQNVCIIHPSFFA